MMKPITIFGLFILFSCTAIGQVEMDFVSAKDSALIGEQVELCLTLKSPEKLHSYVPLVDNIFPPALEILSESVDSIEKNDHWVYRNNYLVTCFDSGIYTIPQLPVMVNNSQDRDTLYSRPFHLVVYSPAVDTAAAIMDIKDPENTPFQLSELKPFIPYIAGGLILIAAVLLFVYYKRKSLRQAEVEKKSLPPHILALETLEKIQKEKLWQQGRVKEYYSELSDTIRIYIEEQYNIPAMESITSEILDAFKKYAWDDDNLMDILENLLGLSDLVKFAKEDPAPSDNEMNLNNAFIFIEKTRPVEKPEEEVMNKV